MKNILFAFLVVFVLFASMCGLYVFSSKLGARKSEKRLELKTKTDSLMKSIRTELKNIQGPLDPVRAREIDQELDSMQREFNAYYLRY